MSGVTRPDKPRSPRVASVLLWLTTALVVVAHAGYDRGGAWCNEASRLATMEALVEHGTFRIDDAWCTAYTVDKAKLAGHLYSTKPPLLSVIGAGVYWVWHRATGMMFRQDTSASVRFVSVVLGTLPLLVLMWTFHRLCRLLTASWPAIVGAYAAFCLANLMLGYAAGVTNHVPAAMGLFAAFSCAYRIRRGLSRGAAAHALGGLAAGFAVAVEHVALVPAVFIALYLLWPARRGDAERAEPPPARPAARHGRWAALAAALLPIVANIALNIAVTGSPMPLFARRDLLRYEGSYWTDPQSVDALHPALPTYVFHMVLGHHGLLSMTPLFVLSLIGLGRQMRRGRPFRREAILILAITVGLVVVYALNPVRNYGGECKGMRWFILAMPFLFLALVFFVERGLGWLGWTAFAVCFAVSALNAFDALRIPWGFSEWDLLLTRIGLGSLPLP